MKYPSTPFLAITGLGVSIAFAACMPPDSRSPVSTKPDCPANGVILSNFAAEVPCDLNPPQVLMVLINDYDGTGSTDDLICETYGGYILSDGTSFFCAGLDY